MKINLIIPSFYPAVVYGGPIFSTLHTCEELAKLDNIEVKVSTTNTNMSSKLDVETNKWKKFSDSFFVKYYNETKIDKFSFALFMNVYKDIKNADIIHIQSIFNTPTPVSLFYAKLFKKPIILSPRGALGLWCINNGSKFKNIWLNYLLKPLVRDIMWHATAEQEKNEILSIYPDANVTIIPNGIEYEIFQKSNIFNKKEYLKKYTNKDINADKILVSMGRIQKKKGFDILINSFKNILNVYPDAKLLIAGDDEGEQKTLEAQIRKLDLVYKVFFIGSVSGQEKIDFLANADVFVLPSHNENFGNVYLESLASGTPIVASTNTPWASVETNKCGKWVNNTEDDTAQAVITLLNEDSDLLSINAKKYAQCYSWKSIAQKFLTVYSSLLDKHL